MRAIYQPQDALNTALMCLSPPCMVSYHFVSGVPAQRQIPGLLVEIGRKRMLLRGSGLKKNARVISNESSLCFQSVMKLVLIYNSGLCLTLMQVMGKQMGEMKPEDASRLFRNSRIWNEDFRRKRERWKEGSSEGERGRGEGGKDSVFSKI